MELSNIEIMRPDLVPIAPFETAKPEPTPLDFRKVFDESLNEVNGLHTKAQVMTEALATGKTNDISEVMMAVQKSNTAFLMLLQLRNKLVDAYDEIMRMRM